MKTMIELEEALDLVLSRIQPVETECVLITDAYNRVLAIEISKKIPI